jgi:hypothetical protein
MKAEPRALLGGFPKGKRPGSTGVGRASLQKPPRRTSPSFEPISTLFSRHICGQVKMVMDSGGCPARARG